MIVLEHNVEMQVLSQRMHICMYMYTCATGQVIISTACSIIVSNSIWLYSTYNIGAWFKFEYLKHKTCFQIRQNTDCFPSPLAWNIQCSTDSQSLHWKRMSHWTPPAHCHTSMGILNLNRNKYNSKMLGSEVMPVSLFNTTEIRKK